jgi:hypothetical protein
MVGGAGISRGGRFDRRAFSRGILVGIIRLRDSDGIGEVCFATQVASLDGWKSFFLSWDVRQQEQARGTTGKSKSRGRKNLRFSQ